jgi:pimeloyl-ACP methyl ester carboxylesterase
MREEIRVDAVYGKLNCLIEGKGPGLIFLHGALGTGAAHFRDQISYFSRKYRVVAPDFLGYGKSGRRLSFEGNLYEEDAQDIAQVIRKLRLDPVNMCGFSDGAIVAMILAREYPELVNSLVLIGGQAIFDENSYAMNKTFIPIEDLPEPFQLALARHHGDPYWRELIHSYLYAQEHMYEQTKGFMVNDLDKILTPTLIAQGRTDPWVDASHAHMLNNAIQNSELIFFQDIGHEVQREKPEQFNKVLEDFLDKF